MKITLTLGEVSNLFKELNTLNSEKGISFIVKYEANLLKETLRPIAISFEKQREKIIKEFGIIEDSNYVLKGEKAEEGTKELLKLIKKEEEIKVKELFSLSDFEKMESEYPYAVLFKIIEK